MQVVLELFVGEEQVTQSSAVVSLLHQSSTFLVETHRQDQSLISEDRDRILVQLSVITLK